MKQVTNRRPLASRQTAWAGTLAKATCRLGLTPNAISVIGIGFAALGAGAMVLAPDHRWLWLVAALGIQLRLLANMLDGLVAIEGGRKSATGALYNEFPDRIEDSLLLVAAGYATALPELGWAAALLAMATAYVRSLGGALGHEQDFCGPMAKQHRMAVLTLAALASAALPQLPVMACALALIAAGSALTAARRLARLAHVMKETAR
jgi:phosphatidylglycerophosphate synthase